MPENEEMLLIEESGFFNAEEVELEDGTKTYDRVYTSEQFCDYFSLFVGNGVFVNPTNQLMVTEATGSIGLKVRINPGWAFINGMYYHLLEEGELELEQNTSTTVRVDGIFCRYSRGDRTIRIIVGKGRVVPKRLAYDYELLLATVNVVSGALSINVSNIRDRRPDEDVCGFVKGLVDVIQTKDLFEQFTANFDQWLNEIKEFFGDDAIGNIYNKFIEIENGKVNKNEYDDAIGNIEEDIASINEELEKKSNKSTVFEKTLSVSSWSGSGIPYSINVNVEGVTETNVVEVGLKNNPTLEQVESWGNANIIGKSQGDGVIALSAYGFKPEIDIPITVIVRRDT